MPPNIYAIWKRPLKFLKYFLKFYFIAKKSSCLLEMIILGDILER